MDTDEPVEIKMYEFEDVERMARRRQEEVRVSTGYGGLQNNLLVKRNLQ